MKPALLTAIVFLIACAHVSLAADEATASKGPLYHVVSMKFKQDADPQKLKNVEDAFRELKTKIPLIQSLHWGTNVSKENRNKGFTHCFVLTFANERDRDAYLKDPAHKAFGQVLGPVVEDVFVIDFMAQD
jgi:hypothetical protein